MNLTPVDVEQKAFTQALRGYQMDEVDDFLDEVVATLRAYEQRLRDAQEKARALETDASTRGGDESAISRAFVAAQRSADAIVADAQAEAEKIRERAIAETDELAVRRDAERSKTLLEIANMRERMGALRFRLNELTGSISQDLTRVETELSGAQDEIGALAESVVVATEPVEELQQRIESPGSLDLSDEEAFGAPLVDDVASRMGARPWERG